MDNFQGVGRSDDPAIFVEIDGNLTPLRDLRLVYIDPGDADNRLHHIFGESGGSVKVTRSKLIRLASEVVDLVVDKNADYGDSWQKQGILGTLCRISDKLLRIETLSDGRRALVAQEGLRQTILDNIGYSLLALLWLNENDKDA